MLNVQYASKLYPKCCQYLDHKIKIGLIMLKIALAVLNEPFRNILLEIKI